MDLDTIHMIKREISECYSNNSNLLEIFLLKFYLIEMKE